MKLNKLTARQVETAKKVGKYGDGGNLWLKIRRPGDASWVFSYMVDGRARELGLGPRHSVNLAEARELARRSRQMILDGVDPIEERRSRMDAQRIEALRTTTFAQAAEQFMATDAVQRLANDKRRRQWKTTISEACKTIGALPLEQIDSAIMLKTLLPVWQRAPETGSRLRGRLERIFAWALAHKLYQGTNPASLDVLRDALPAKPKQKHHAAMPYADLPAFMKELRSRNSLSARALEFTVLTAARTSEVLGATWSEFDLDQAVWEIPGSRMKAGKPHKVPLPDAALAILRGIKANFRVDAKSVFINGNGKPLSNMAMLALMKGMGVDATPHGMRSAFMDFAHEKTGYPKHVIDMAHTIGDKVEAAYRRGDLFAKRRRLMAEWARYLEAPASRRG